MTLDVVTARWQTMAMNRRFRISAQAPHLEVGRESVTVTMEVEPAREGPAERVTLVLSLACHGRSLPELPGHILREARRMLSDAVDELGRQGVDDPPG